MFMLQDEIYSDSIIPFLKKELKRKVNLFGKVILNGGIYCQNLEVEAGDIFIQKSVFVDEGIIIKGKDGGQVWFQSLVDSEYSILVDEKSDIHVRFGKTIRSKNINLYNTIVYGNIIGENITLKNSVVLGGAFANKVLNIDNSIVGTYHCSELKHYNSMGLLYPIAISENLPELSDKIYMVVPESISKGNDGVLFNLSKNDFYPLIQNGRKRYVFSNTMRIFDLRLFYQNLQENIEKIFDADKNDSNDIENLKDRFFEFDKKYFFFINNHFKRSRKKIWSNYMEIETEILKEYFEAVKNNIEVTDETKQKPAETTVDGNKEASDNNGKEKESGISQNTDERIIKSVELENQSKPEDEAREEPAASEAGADLLKDEKDELVTKKISSEFKVGKEIDQLTKEETEEFFLICPHCGATLKSDFMFCHECGKRI